jgi:hypothetical protein
MIYYVYVGTTANENNKLATVSKFEPATNRAWQDVVFVGTQSEVIAWSVKERWSLIWSAT